MPAASPLTKIIGQITANSADEPDLYAYVRDLLTRRALGVGLHTGQVVIDSKLSNSRRRPDLVVFRTAGGKPLRGPDYAIAVFEVKTGNLIETNGKAVLREKRAYVQSGTRWFFLIDQRVVTRVDAADRARLVEALESRRALPAELAMTWSWDDLGEADAFRACFSVLSAAHLSLEQELAEFRANRTRYSYLDASGEGRSLFGATIREASELIRAAVAEIIATRAAPDLEAANAMLASMVEDYGAPVFDFSDPRRPIEFERTLEPRLLAQLTDEQVVDYQPRLDALMADVEPVLYALRLEHDLLQKYADRQGIETASLLKLESEADKPNNRLVQALIYETASLILSRMLTIRFCEDHGLFSVRYISNGGIEVFWRFADHFVLPMQELLRQTYRHARDVFRSIFDANLLDWAVRRDDPVLSRALERAAFILSRWDFSTVRGDILSGVYDQYLDVSQRRRLGEVYTRPEVARFMLHAAGWQPHQTVLDPACGTGTFLVEALVQRLDALAEAGAINADNVRSVLSRLHGLDISTFAVTLAHIQVFWHMIEVVRDKSIDEIRAFARSILPVLRIYGGWSSLDTMGDALGAGTAAQSGMAFRVSHADRRRAQALVPPGFERTSRGTFDLVLMNPPYIRTERAGSANHGTAYDTIAFKNTDTSIYFIYRALRQWVKPAGRLAFIVPVGISEAAYAGLLRRELADYRITLVADLEGLGKATFRGVKRPTIIMVVEKAPSSPEDLVSMLQLDAGTLVDDVVDFSKARSSTVTRRDLDRLAYLPAALGPAIATPEPADGRQAQGAGGGVDAEETEASRAESGDGPFAAAGPERPAEAEPDAEVDAAVAAAPRAVRSLPVWVQALRANEDSADALLTKLNDGDPEALAAMRELPRLGEIIRVVWVKRVRGRVAEVLGEEPQQERYAYRPELLFNYGVKLGGSKALTQAGDGDAIALYKGQNIFPQGMLGDPLGYWSPTSRLEQTRYIYTYRDHLTYRNTYALREISQLPTAAPVGAGAGFQNTAYILELTEDFPLNSYLLSRIVQFYAARVLRSSIIEDLGCHWYKRTVPLLPIPPHRSPERLQALREAGDAVLEADSDLADRHRAINAMIVAGTSSGRTLNSMIVNGEAHAAGIDLRSVSETPVPVLEVSEVGDQIHGSDLFFRLTVPDASLRTYLAFQLERALEGVPDAELSRDSVLDLLVPDNLEAVAEAIRLLSTDDLEQNYESALEALDGLVADQIGLDGTLRDHVVAAMRTDPILSKMRPMIARRGLRIQPYADHSDGDRYD